VTDAYTCYSAAAVLPDRHSALFKFNGQAVRHGVLYTGSSSSGNGITPNSNLQLWE
jgi:hypothetical protein